MTTWLRRWIASLVLVLLFVHGVVTPFVRAADPTPRQERPRPQDAKKVRLDCFGDPLPAGAIARLGTVRFRHSGEFYCFIFSPDGKTIASCSGSTTHLWDVATGREVWRVESDSTEKEDVWTLAFSRDGKLLACGGRRGEVSRLVLREAATGKQRRLLDGNDSYIAQVAFAPDGKTFASAAYARGNRHTVRLWNVETGAELHCLDGSARVAFSPDGKMLATAGKAGGGPIRLWNPVSGQAVGSLPSNNEEDSIGRIVFSANGKNLAVGSRSSKPQVDSIVLWDIASAKEVRTFVGTMFACGGFDLSPDSRLLAAPNVGGPVLLWDITTGKNMSRFPGTLNAVNGVAFSPDGKLLVCANHIDHAIHLWDPLTGQPVRPVDASVKGVTTVVISSDGRTAASWTRYERLVRLWETATGKQSGAIKDQEPYAMAMVPGKSPRLLVHDGSWNTFYDFASKTQQKLNTGGTAESLDFGDGDRLLFCGEVGGTIRVQDAATGKFLRRFSGAGYLAPSADGKLLASAEPGRSDYVLKLWDVEAGMEHPAFRDKKISGACVTLTPDGRILAAHDDSDTVHFWDIATGRLLRMSPGRSGRPTALAFAPDGRTLAEGRTDGTIRLLETATGGERRILPGHSGQVTSLAWSADSRVLISASNDTTALVWDATGLSSDPPSTTKLSPAELESLWSDLAGPTNSQTHRAFWILAGRPDQAVPFLRDRVRPMPAVDPEVIARLLSELDSEQFSVRDLASRELRKLNETAEPAMRKILANKPSAEVRKRVERLLESLAEWLPEDLRALRAIEALEHMDGPDAKTLLEALAKGSPGSRLNHEAESSLKSLGRRHVALGKAAVTP